MPKLLVVIGATGQQGHSLITYCQTHQPQLSLRGLTRTPNSLIAQSLAKSGVEIVQADLNSPETLPKAFSGASFIFAYTDFGGTIASPAVMGKFAAGELSPPLGAESYKIELQHGKNIADAAAGVAGLKRLVWSGLADVKRLTKGKYSQVFHSDAKAAVTEYMFSLEALKGKVSVVHMGIFMNNASKVEIFGFRRQPDNSLTWQFPYPPTHPLPWFDVQNDTGPFVKALIECPAPTQVVGVSEWLSCQQWLDLWSAQTGVPSRYEHVSEEAYTKDDPTGLKLQFWEAVQFSMEYGVTGGDPEVVMPEDLEKKGFPIPRTKVAEYMAREDWSRFVD